jgi:hypothetical protein
VRVAQEHSARETREMSPRYDVRAVRFLAGFGGFGGAGVVVAASWTIFVANTRGPWSSKSIVVWYSLTVVTVPHPN